MHTEHDANELVGTTVIAIQEQPNERFQALLVMMTVAYMETACYVELEQIVVLKSIKNHTKSTVAQNECDRQLTLI